MRLVTGGLILILVIGPFWFAKMNLYSQLRSTKHQVKALLLQSIPSNDLKTFRFTASEYLNLNWEHEREFELEGLMYDVVETTVSNGIYQLVCYPDTEESLIKKKLKALLTLEHKKPGSSPSTLPWEQFAKGLFVSTPVSPIALILVSNHWCNFQAEVPHPGYSSQLSPPPNYCC